MINEKRNYLILGAAFIAFVLSIYLYFTGQTQEGIFTGIWVHLLSVSESLSI